jgi:hypothetical protein
MSAAVSQSGRGVDHRRHKDECTAKIGTSRIAVVHLRRTLRLAASRDTELVAFGVEHHDMAEVLAV